jgi:hypothetical protein
MQIRQNNELNQVLKCLRCCGVSFSALTKKETDKSVTYLIQYVSLNFKINHPGLENFLLQKMEE